MHKGTGQKKHPPAIRGLSVSSYYNQKSIFLQAQSLSVVYLARSYDKTSGFLLESAGLSGIPVLHLTATQCRQDTVSSWIGFCGTGNAEVSRLVAFRL